MRRNRSLHHRTMTLITGTLLCAGALSAWPTLDAQSPPPRRQGPPGPPTAERVRSERMRPDRGRPDRMRGNPAAGLLRARTALGLTDDQVKRLETLQRTAPTRPNDAEMLRARADLLEATRGDGNLSAARTAFDRMNRLRTEQALAGLKARQEVRNVLTAEQKARLDNRKIGRRGMGKGMQRGQTRGMGRGAQHGMQRGKAMHGRGMGPGMGRGFAPGR